MPNNKFLPLPSGEPVGSETTKERARIPEQGVSAPSYSYINQYSQKVGGEGAISFYQALEGISRRRLDDSLKQNEQTQAGALGIELMNRLNQDSLEFKQNNPSGEGYMEFMTSQVGKHKEDLKKNASTENVSSSLDSFSMKLHQDWANKSFSEENAMRTASTRNQALQQAGEMLSIVRDTPENKDAVWINYKNTFENCKGILTAQDYQKFERKLTEDFNVSVLLGHTAKDPYNASALLKDKNYTKGISAHRLNQLQEFMASSIKTLEKRNKQAEKVAEADYKNRANIERSELELQLAYGSLSEEDVVSAQYISEIQRNQLLTKMARRDKKTLSTQDNFALVCQHAELGTDPNLSHEDLNKAYEYELSILSGQNGEPTANVYAIQGAKYNTNLKKYCKKITNSFRFGGVQDVIESVGAFRLSQQTRSENIASINTASFNAFATMVETSFNPNDKSISNLENIKRYREIIFDKEKKSLTDEQKQALKRYNPAEDIKDSFQYRSDGWFSNDTFGGNNVDQIAHYLRAKVEEGMRLGLGNEDATTFAKSELARVSVSSELNRGHKMFLAPEVVHNVSQAFVRNRTAKVINECTKDDKSLAYDDKRLTVDDASQERVKDFTKNFNVVYVKTDKSSKPAYVLGEPVGNGKYNLFYIHPISKAKVYIKDPARQYLTNVVVTYDK